jgi:peroxiredoxin
MSHSVAPELQVAEWLNADAPPSLAALRGQVVVLHAFQMLCPGCVSHALPQMERLREAFTDRGLAIIGLHSVFEHHAAMAPHALRAFAHEYRLDYPIAIDRHDTDDPIPRTMRAYGLRGTPSLVLIDRDSRIRLHRFGRMGDLELGAAVGELLAEDKALPAFLTPAQEAPPAPTEGCDEEACGLDTMKREGSSG